MKCIICQYGETEPGTTTVALTRGETTIVIRDVPAEICTICGEEYVDAVTGKRLSQIAEKAVNEGVQVDVRRYKLHRSPKQNWLFAWVLCPSLRTAPPYQLLHRLRISG